MTKIASGDVTSHEALSRRIDHLETVNRLLRDGADHAGNVLRSAIDHAIITLNLGGRITGWNPGAEQILGHARAEVLGQSGAILFTEDDQRAGMFVDRLCEALYEGRAAMARWHLRQDGTRFWADGTMVPLQGADNRPCGFLIILRDGTKAHAAEERMAFLLAEVRHRAKNIFSTVLAVARQTARRPDIDDAFRQAFNGRLTALARSHDIAETGATTLGDVVRHSLEPYEGSAGRIAAAGPPVTLAGRAAAPLQLVFHELATNAAKYGALSVAEGKVDVTWTLEAAGAEPASQLAIVWRERDGPRVSRPRHRGFGSSMIERSLAQESGGTARLDFMPQGVTCRIRLPFATLHA